MSNYSDFELKIIAQASKEVNDSPNYRVLEKLKRFMREQIALAGDTYYKFRKWNNEYNQEQVLRKFGDLKREIKLECDKISQVDLEQELPVLSENDIIDIESLSDKEQAVFYKAKVDLLTREFSKSNLLFLGIFLPLTRQMLKMNKRPTDLFGDDAAKIIERLRQKQEACVASAATRRKKKAEDRDAELKIFEIMHDIAIGKSETGLLCRSDKHLLLIKFCIVSDIIDIEIRKEIIRQTKTPTEKTEQILDHLRYLKKQLAHRKKLETILLLRETGNVFDKLRTYCQCLKKHYQHKLNDILDDLCQKLFAPDRQKLEKFDKMLLMYGANDDIADTIYDWLDNDSVLRPFVQEMLRRVRQRLKTARITSS